jgi:phytoene/squalene synthetase
VSAPALSPVLEELRARAPAEFFAALLAPPDRRDTLAALWLMEIETARVPALVENPIIGLMRLQFWRDAIESATDGRRLAHPAADVLRTAVADGVLDPALLAEHFEAREAVLGGGEADAAAPIARLATALAGTRVARLPGVAARFAKFGTRARLAMLWAWAVRRG